MSVYIPGMEMPTICGDCRFCGGIADTDCGLCAWCNVDGNARVADTRQDCPLVLVPDHGRLIDADALKNIVYAALKDTLHDDNTTSYGAALCAFIAKNIADEIEAAPTIIPAEEGEKDAVAKSLC